MGKHDGFLEYDWRRISCGNGNELFKNLKWITGDRSLIRAIYINFLVETDWCKNKKYQWKRTPWPIYKCIALSAVPKKKAFDRNWRELLIRKGVHFSSIIKLGMPYRRTSYFRLLFWKKLIFFNFYTTKNTLIAMYKKSHKQVLSWKGMDRLQRPICQLCPSIVPCFIQLAWFALVTATLEDDPWV